MDFLVASIAAMGTVCFSNPFDVLKTRMQLQGELQKKGQHVVHYKNLFHAGYIIVKKEGVLSLQKGLSIAIVVNGVRNGIRLGLYQWMFERHWLSDSEGRTIFYRSFLGSAFTGMCGAFVGSPLFMVKTHLQAQAARDIAVGHQHDHANAFQALQKIFTEHGVKGLWRGVGPNMLRTLVGSASQISSFSKTKDIMKDYGLFVDSPVMTSFVASIIGGIFQVVAINPFDLISIRLYNQAIDAKGRGLLYGGFFDCVFKIWSSEGFIGFYKGIGANYMRLAPHGIINLILWDVLKDLKNKYFPKNK